MFNAIVELFLSEYFVITASVGKFVGDYKDLFVRLSKVFLIGETDADKLFRLCDSEAVRDVVTEQDYLRHRRLRAFSAITGDKDALDPDLEEIIRVKGGALASASKQKLSFDPQTSRNVGYSALVTAANSGVVSALKLMGFLQCEGIFLDKNLNAGVKNLAKAANWNDCVATLALLRFCKTDRDYNMSRLKMIVDGTPFESLYDRAVKVYGCKMRADVPEVRLLNRAFNSAILNRGVYNPVYARVLYGGVLSFKDKEKAMFSSDSGKLSALCELPLKLNERNIICSDVSRLNEVALLRENEQRKIKTALNNADMRTYEKYRPLCLVSDSLYLLNMYAGTISARSDNCRYELINVADLSGYDLEPSANNVFVRSVDEDVDNRFLMFFVGAVPDKTMDFVKNFLLTSRRAKFHLNTPNVTLNLSAVLPICFCDSRNARMLEDLLDTVRLADVADDELSKAVSDVVFGKKALYGVNIAFKGNVSDVFADRSIDKIERLIDAIARDHRKQDETVVITREVVNEYDFDFNKRIGFGA